MEQITASSVKAQETERKISELEQKCGISTATEEQPGGDRQPKEPGEPQPQITREEYEVIKSVFVRLGCDSLITYSDFFVNFICYSYDRFFRHQPKAVQVLCNYMNSQTTTNNERQQIRSYIDSLETVSETLYAITENNAIFDEAEKLCDALNVAHTQYQ